MKNLLLAAAMTLVSSAAWAATYRSCATDLHLMADDMSETKLGSVVVDLTVVDKETAQASLVFTGLKNETISSNMTCAITTENFDVNDMQCRTEEKISKELGHISLSFNSLEAPYHVAVFVGESNAPNGSFFTDDCQSSF